MNSTYLDSCNTTECFGCSACEAICPVGAISMKYDAEGFNYPVIDEDACIHCDRCRKVCPAPMANSLQEPQEQMEAFGGSHRDPQVLERSTSGGAFSALAQTWLLQPDSLCWGAVADENDPLKIHHDFVEGYENIDKLRRSKYVQSQMGDSFKLVVQQLKEGRQVMFVGTPCQVAGLKSFMQLKASKFSDRLLLVEVMCEGVPTPHFMEKYVASLEQDRQAKVTSFDWRFKHGRRWDFEFMRAGFESGKEQLIARWFNPFWSIWLKHLMNRPSCYACPFATRDRVADLTIADLWGVHIYCPDLYARNAGASLVLQNTEKGRMFWQEAQQLMEGHKLDLDDVVRFQGPMRDHIAENPDRPQFMAEVIDPAVGYEELCRKWADEPSAKLLFQKYLWGNRQKVALWRLLHPRNRQD